MSEDISNPRYWKMRLHCAAAPHHVLCYCPEHDWNSYVQEHIEQLGVEVQPNESILDIGCAFGRLLEMLPRDWVGDYMGFDLSPDFIEIAKTAYPLREFHVCKIEDVESVSQGKIWDVGVLVSIKGMVIREQGGELWNEMEGKLNKVCKRLLILEYGEH